MNVAEKKISSLKSHDYHILLQYLIPIATHSLLPDNVYDAIVRLSKFFHLLCQKTLNRDILTELHQDIVLVLGKLETIFPLHFLI